MRKIWAHFDRYKGITVSLVLHLICLSWLYSIQLLPGTGREHGESYRITLQSKNRHTISTDRNSITPPPISTVDTLTEPVVSTDIQAIPRKKTKRLKNRKRLAKTSAQPRKAATINKQELYNIGQLQTKKLGATLELTGWEWETVPIPKDTTEEYGKIVFEIKVDKNGEIISIKTIEKTVTPIVEKIYLEALRVTSFRKTNDNQEFSNISTGKVSFLLIVK